MNSAAVDSWKMGEKLKDDLRTRDLTDSEIAGLGDYLLMLEYGRSFETMK